MQSEEAAHGVGIEHAPTPSRAFCLPERLEAVMPGSNAPSRLLANDSQELVDCAKWWAVLGSNQ